MLVAFEHDYAKADTNDNISNTVTHFSSSKDQCLGSAVLYYLYENKWYKFGVGVAYWDSINNTIYVVHGISSYDNIKKSDNSKWTYMTWDSNMRQWLYFNIEPL